MTSEVRTATVSVPSADMAGIREMVSACMQCGTCSASCPNAPSMDMTPRRLWRLAVLGREDEILESRTFWLCSSCWSCSLRCPRGLPLTDAMAALKRVAAGRDTPEQRKKGAFYAAFMNNVRAHGRVKESALMARYFMARRDIGLPLKYTRMGMRLIGKGKLKPEWPWHAGPGRLDTIFTAALKVDARQEDRS